MFALVIDTVYDALELRLLTLSEVSLTPLFKTVRWIYDSIFQSLWDRTFTVLKSNFEWIGYLYDNRVFGLKIRSRNLSSIVFTCSYHITSILNSLIFFEDYHWPFDLDWLFKIWTDPGFIQNPIRGLRYFWYIDWSGKVVSDPRGSKVNWVNLPVNHFQYYKDIYIISDWCGIWSVITADSFC